MCQFHSSLARRTLLVGVLAAVAPASMARATGRVWAIVGATVIDSTRSEPIRDGVIVIVGDRIAWVGAGRVPDGVDVIDGRGKYVIPGLIEAHHHLGGQTLDERAANLQKLLTFGYTTVFDPAVSLTNLTALKDLARPDSPYPRYLATGPMLATPGGWGDFGFPAPEVRLLPNPEAAAAAVDEFAEAGVDAIKAANDDFSWGGRRTFARMPVELQRAIVAAANRHGLPTFFHAPSRSLAIEALEAGAKGLLHGIVDEPIDRSFRALMRRTGASYTDTHSLFEALGDLVGYVDREQAFDRRNLHPAATYDALRSPEAIGQVEFLVDPAIVRSHLPTLRTNARSVPTIAFGSDGGTFGQAVGISSHVELVLHGEAGLSAHQVIRGATLGAARALKRHHQLGSLTPGKLADLVILSADPLADLANLHYVDSVVKAGRIFTT